MGDVLLQPFLAGLSTGLFCCLYCLPFIAPVMASEGRTGRQSAGLLGWFLGGRLAGYLLFGAAAGLAGERLCGPWLDAAASAAMVLTAVLLLAHAAGLRRHTPGCLTPGPRRARIPFVMGLLMGVNVCPPFLLSLAYVFSLHSAARGILYFVVFFVASSVYFLPLGALGWLGRLPELRRAARASAVLVGVFFAAYGLYALARPLAEAAR